MTAFYGVLDPVAGRLTYANAGHNPPLLISRGPDAATIRLDRTSLPLGIRPDMTVDQRTVDIAPENILLLYTDGLIEAENEVGQPFGLGRLSDFVQAHAECRADELLDDSLAQLSAFTGNAPPADDITVVILKRVE